jgi:hypothetical protein
MEAFERDNTENIQALFFFRLFTTLNTSSSSNCILERTTDTVFRNSVSFKNPLSFLAYFPYFEKNKKKLMISLC